MVNRLWPVMRKEFIHIQRDPRTLAVMFLAPLMQLILLATPQPPMCAMCRWRCSTRIALPPAAI